jgi:hypothetical protein
MKAINTFYKGYRFRSRLEARYAVFFDALNIDWEYEKEGYVLSDGTCYLPDFWLPTFNGGMFVEIKPKAFSNSEKQKCRDLCYESGFDVWLADGVPSERAFVYMSKDNDNNCVVYSCGIPNHDKAKGQDRMFEDPSYCMTSYAIPRCELKYGMIGQAVKEAKEARFEFDR